MWAHTAKSGIIHGVFEIKGSVKASKLINNFKNIYLTPSGEAYASRFRQRIVDSAWFFPYWESVAQDDPMDKEFLVHGESHTHASMMEEVSRYGI
jgi:hypothetical protein